MTLSHHERQMAATAAEKPRVSRVTAVLGPTNTGKTHYAIERMLSHRSGMIGLPLRLLAREVYDRVVAQKGADAVALITGEEKIVPRAPDYWVCTVESMPLEIETEFLAVDEIQLCADHERGHIFTDRLLRARGTHETVVMGAEAMRGVIQRLVPHTNVVTRPRFSDLAYIGERKLTRLPRRSAVVAFSADAVYAIAELIRRERGGAAIVMGALSPRTRNAQVALYQSGDVDFLVATDAIGMGLNMDVDHVAFAALEKFDGHATRPLRAEELSQIAGRAGRYRDDGTFGVTAGAAGIDANLVEQIENHRFDPIRTLQWRNANVDFATVAALIKSLEMPAPAKGLVRAREAGDLAALRLMISLEQVSRLAVAPAAIKRLWEVAQVPDFRKSAIDEHARFLTQIYLHLMSDTGVLPADWIAGHVARLDDIEGDIDLIAQRIAHIRTWTYAANRPGWLADSAHWQERTRAIEDRLSDALHEKLSQRFVDRRTSVLMKRLRADEDFTAAVGENGECTVEGEYVGRLEGFRFVADPRASGLEGKALRQAALRGLQGEIAARAYRVANADDKEITLSEHGKLWWDGSAVGRILKGPSILKPRVELIADDQLTPTARARAQGRLETWIADHLKRGLAPLLKLNEAAADTGIEKLEGPARGMAYRLTEALGAIPRNEVANEVRALEPDARAKLRKLGIRFGEFSVFMPALMKPGAAHLKALLWAVHEGLADIPPPPPAGVTSAASDAEIPKGFYEAAGFRVLGPRIVRLDMLERLADVLRAKREPKPQAKPDAKAEAKPEAAPSASSAEASAPASPEPAAETPSPETASSAPDARSPRGFAITPDMLSLLGCGIEDMEGVLGALGYRAFEERAADGTAQRLFRPRNRRDGERPPRGKPFRPRPQQSEQRQGAEGDGEKRGFKGRPHKGKPRHGGEHNREHHREREGGGGKPSPDAAGRKFEKHGKDRHHRDDQPRHERPHEDRPRNDRPRENRPWKDRPREEKRRETKIDPNSPFAKLAILKDRGPQST